MGGGGVADFLARGEERPEGKAVIESLVAEAEKSREQPESPEPEQPPTEAQSNVLQELLTNPRDKQSDAPETPAKDSAIKTSKEAPSQSQADRSVVDGLLGNEKKESGE